MAANVDAPVGDDLEFARALVIGHAAVTIDDFEGTESSSASGDPGPGAGFSEVVRDHVALQEFLKKRGCHIQTGTVCDTDLTRDSCMKRIVEFLRHPHVGLRILIFLGEGSKENGAWCFVDNEMIRLTEINNIWNDIDRESTDNLLVYSDSCYSGYLCQEASRSGARFFVQASCAEDEEASETVFTAMWIRVHQEPQNRHTIVDRFQAQNQQTVVYYAPQQSSGAQVLTCGTLTIQLLGKHISASEDHASSAAAPPQSTASIMWQEMFESLPSDLQLLVTQLLERPGWRCDDPHVVQIMKGLLAKYQQEPRRGGNDEAADISDILELLQEFVDDEFEPAQALAKFNEEFD